MKGQSLLAQKQYQCMFLWVLASSITATTFSFWLFFSTVNFLLASSPKDTDTIRYIYVCSQADQPA